MDLRKVKKLIELVEEAGIAELEVSSGDESVRITMPLGAVATPVVQTQPTDAVDAAATSDERGSDSDNGARQTARASAAEIVAAPMAGTFYRAPNPEAAPFVEVGQSVTSGDVLCIIESMKMMNEIRAVADGVVRRILVANGEPIGTGTGLFEIS